MQEKYLIKFSTTRYDKTKHESNSNKTPTLLVNQDKRNFFLNLIKCIYEHPTVNIIFNGKIQNRSFKD